jgi:hypothetical protein
MPKIALRYTGSDEALMKRLEATEGLQYFEPVDAREVLATPGCEYEVDDESRKLMGAQFQAGSRGDGLNVPQLQGDDQELQTGLSDLKYGRSQVVKAIPDAMMPTTGAAQSTIGRPLDLSQVGEGGGAQAARMTPSSEGGDGGAPLSEGMTRQEIAAELTRRNVPHDGAARKDELAQLLDKQAR